MTAINPGIGTHLEWHQPKAFQRYYELAADGDLAATLRFESRYGTLATAEYGGRRWTFKRAGFWSPRISVRDAGATTDTAVFIPKWKGGGELIFQSGRRFFLKSISFWEGEWAFESETGVEIVSLQGPRGLFHNRGDSSIGLGASTLPETPVLLLLIWYLRLLMQEDAAAATVVACG